MSEEVEYTLIICAPTLQPLCPLLQAVFGGTGGGNVVGWFDGEDWIVNPPEDTSSLYRVKGTLKQWQAHARRLSERRRKEKSDAASTPVGSL